MTVTWNAVRHEHRARSERGGSQAGSVQSRVMSLTVQVTSGQGGASAARSRVRSEQWIFPQQD